MAGEGNERGSSMASFQLLHTGLDFVPIDPPYQRMSSREEEADVHAMLATFRRHGRHAAGATLGTEPPDDDDDERIVLPIPHLSLAGDNTFPSRAGRIVSRSVTAVKMLETKRYGGPEESASADDSTGCVICIQDYEVGDEISVVPCAGGHRFHRRCLDVWLTRKPLCPLCRHTLADEPNAAPMC